MARLIRPFEGFPDYDDFDDYDAYDEAERSVWDKLCEQADDVDPDDDELIGALLRWQRADGYAHYRVVAQDPLTLQHVPFGDGYRVEPALIRGLREEDARKQLRHREKMADVFGGE